MSEPVLFIQDLAVILLSAALFGYICSRLGLSPVVGYLVAGFIVGTPEIIVPYLSDEARIEVIAQLGVVFLMFSIGLQFRLERVKQLGLPIVIATALTAIFVLTAGRFCGALLGLSPAAGFALAAIFMGSSSAIISKVIQEKGFGHERHGQLSLGITLMEDIVAVIILAVLGSYVLVGGDASVRTPVETIWTLVGFTILVFILGILLIPKILQGLTNGGKYELAHIFLAGILLFMSLVAVRAGYSLALGGFLCGMIVAETRQKALVERTFQGLKDVFLTVFFVTIGMMIDMQAVPGAFKWIIVGAFGALIGRATASFSALLLVGEKPRTALRSSLCLTPIGEFSFIIAGVAVAAGLFSETFQVAAVGTALITSILSPILMGQSEKISQFVAEDRLPRFNRIHQVYTRFLNNLSSSGRENVLWNLLRRRMVQIGVELLFITAVFLFASPLYANFQSLLPDRVSDSTAYAVYWLILGILCLIPLVSIWRNTSAVTMIIAEYANRDREKKEIRMKTLEILLKTLFGLFLLIWIWNILPGEIPRGYLIAFLVLLAPALVYFSWHQMVRLHSQLEWSIDESFSNKNNSEKKLFQSWRDAGWNLNLEEITLPDDSIWSGKAIMDTKLRKQTGCAIVGLSRHGYNLTHVGPATHLFPGDEMLILGSSEQLEEGRRLLSERKKEKPIEDGLENRLLESFQLEPNHPAVGKKLSELNWSRIFGVQVAALLRDGKTQSNIDATTRLEAGDTILLLGRMESIQKVTGPDSKLSDLE